MECVNKVQDGPCPVQIVRKPKFLLELATLRSLSLLGRGALLDHCHSTRGDPEEPCDLLACHSLRTHLNDPSVTLAGCRHGAKNLGTACRMLAESASESNLDPCQRLQSVNSGPIRS
jgi:hypothetical protein